MIQPPLIPADRKAIGDGADRIANGLRRALLSECRQMAIEGTTARRESIMGGSILLMINLVAMEGGDDKLLEDLVDLGTRCMLHLAGVQLDHKLIVKDSGTVQ